MLIIGLVHNNMFLGEAILKRELGKVPEVKGSIWYGWTLNKNGWSL